MNYRKKANEWLVKYNHSCEQIKSEKTLLAEAEQQLQYVEEAQKILQGLAQSVQQRVHDNIASLVSRCLSTVFSDPYEFQIHFEQKRGKTEARMVFVRDGKEINPATASGGGVMDVASFALRLSCLILSQPKLRRVLVLDEPFRHLSRNNVKRIRTLLDTLSQELQIQFIIVTHNKELVVGKVVELD